MAGLWNALKDAIRIERLGDLTLDWLKVLVYLGNTKRGGRESSAENLGKELGVSENMITNYAYPALIRKGFIRLLAANLPERDANSYELTAKGKKALGQLLNTIGYFDAAFVGILTFALGVLLGELYLPYQMYPTYFVFILLLAVIAGSVLTLFIINIVRASRSRRREVLSVMLRKPEQGI